MICFYVVHTYGLCWLRFSLFSSSASCWLPVMETIYFLHTNCPWSVFLDIFTLLGETSRVESSFALVNFSHFFNFDFLILPSKRQNETTHKSLLLFLLKLFWFSIPAEVVFTSSPKIQLFLCVFYQKLHAPQSQTPASSQLMKQLFFVYGNGSNFN